MASVEMEAKRATDLPKAGGQAYSRAHLNQGTFSRAGWWPRQSQCFRVLACGFQPTPLHGKEQCLWAEVECGAVSIPLPPKSQPSAPSPVHPPAQPSYLVGLKIIIQGKLQFAQILWLFLFLSFTFSLSQAGLCIVIILWGLGKRRIGLRGENGAWPVQGHQKASPSVQTLT